MTSPTHNQYLEAKVLTAPSHELHLMLIEAAIRSSRQAKSALERGEVAAAGSPLMRVIEIMEELLAAVRKSNTQLNKQIADFYLFLFRRFSEAKINGDVAKLNEALQLLEFERQTWQLVCDKLAADAPGSAEAKPRSPMGLSFGKSSLTAEAQGFSLEA